MGAGIGLMMGIGVLIGNVLGETLRLGTYGYLHDKKKWSSWKSGATVGLITGGLGLVTFGILGAVSGGMQNMMAASAAAPALTPNSTAGLGAYVMQPLMNQTGMGALVMQKVAGCAGCK